MKKILKNKKGFTLIELIVVIAIIAILAAIAIPTFSGVINNAKKVEAQSIARNAYMLAQVNLLEDEIAGIDLELTDTDLSAIYTAAGTNEGECTITHSKGNESVTSVEVTIGTNTVTYDGSSMN